MLTEVQNSELYAEWASFIQSKEVRAAFYQLIGIATCSKTFNCNIQWKSKTRDFRFYNEAGEQPHSFITNQHWLLFYFRPPAVRSGKYSRDRLLEDFDSFNENRREEWTIKIKNIKDIEVLSNHISWGVPLF